MFIAPTAQEARKGIAPTIRVATTSIEERIQKPETDPGAFAEAAHLALVFAHENGYQVVAFESVSEFVKLTTEQHDVKNFTGQTVVEHARTWLVYEYVWMFTAWDPIEEPA